MANSPSYDGISGLPQVYAGQAAEERAAESGARAAVPAGYELGPDEIDYTENEPDALVFGNGRDNRIEVVLSSRALYGGAGDDVLIGGPVTFNGYGQDGDDIIVGGSGSNVSNGGKGDDRFITGAGNNVIQTGPQDQGDTIIVSPGSGDVLITDFDPRSDRIDFSRLGVTDIDDFYSKVSFDEGGPGAAAVTIEGVRIVFLRYSDFSDFTANVLVFDAVEDDGGQRRDDGGLVTVTPDQGDVVLEGFDPASDKLDLSAFDIANEDEFYAKVSFDEGGAVASITLDGVTILFAGFSTFETFTIENVIFADPDDGGDDNGGDTGTDEPDEGRTIAVEPGAGPVNIQDFDPAKDKLYLSAFDIANEDDFYAKVSFFESGSVASITLDGTAVSFPGYATFEAFSLDNLVFADPGEPDGDGALDYAEAESSGTVGDWTVLAAGTDAPTRLAGTEGDERMTGGAGDDLFIASAGIDILHGGDGDDRIVFEGTRDDYQLTGFSRSGVTLFTRADGSEKTYLSDIETAVFTDGSDELALNTQPADTPYGGAYGESREINFGTTAFDQWAGEGRYFDGVDGSGSLRLGYGLSDYELTLNIDGTITMSREIVRFEGQSILSHVTLKNMSSVTFTGEDGGRYEFDQLAEIAIQQMEERENQPGDDGSGKLFEAGDEGGLLIGTIGPDEFRSGAGNDVYYGGAGDDVMIGGDGFDHAVYVGDPSDYTFARNADGSVTVDHPDYGRDRLTGIESIRFADNPEASSGKMIPVDFLIASYPSADQDDLDVPDTALPDETGQAGIVMADADLPMDDIAFGGDMVAFEDVPFAEITA